MMRLRYLFDNRELAEMLVRNWEYDRDSLDLFQYFRISANAIYPFKAKGQVLFLRFSPVVEKSKTNLLAELEFMEYLRGAGYHAMEAVPSRGGEELVQRMTPWGEYYASVFRRVKGEQISEAGYEERVLFAYGTALGTLHRLSSQFDEPKVKRWRYLDVLSWIEGTLAEGGGEDLAMEEARLLRDFFGGLPRSKENYGLVHYDFEPDNVFFDEATGLCSAIDFDDAMYHWYVMDLEQVLDSLSKEMSGDDFPEMAATFLEGYKSQFPIDQELILHLQVFHRFAELYRYARIGRATQERWENEPEWMDGLREKLSRARARACMDFGREIVWSGAGGMSAFKP
jgi:Ser/Thr protein kinase RdoA (MazF antagonist)